MCALVIWCVGVSFVRFVVDVLRRDCDAIDVGPNIFQYVNGGTEMIAKSTKKPSNKARSGEVWGHTSEPDTSNIDNLSLIVAKSIPQLTNQVVLSTALYRTTLQMYK